MYAGHKHVKVVTLPWNHEVEPADVTLVVGRNARGPVGGGVGGTSGEFFLKLHPQSANPACVNKVTTTFSHKPLLASLRPFFFNSGDIFTFRKLPGRYQPIVSAYETRELYNLEFALLDGIAHSKQSCMRNVSLYDYPWLVFSVIANAKGQCDFVLNIFFLYFAWPPVYRLMIHEKVFDNDPQVLTEDGQRRSGDVVIGEGQRRIPPKHLLDLLDDLLAHAFSYLDFGTMQNILPFVCARFDRVARRAVFLDEFHIECDTVLGGLQELELELLCRRKPHIRMMRIKSEGRQNPWTTQDIPRTIFNLASQKSWSNMTHLSVVGRFATDIEEMLVDLLRSGSMRSLQNLRVMLERALSCHSLTYWDTPNLKTVKHRTGPLYWEFFPQNNFEALFRVPGNLINFALSWSPFCFMMPNPSRDNLRYWPYPANHFLDRCGLHNSVESLSLLAVLNPLEFAVDHNRWPLRPSALVNPWPKVTHLTVRPFVFDSDEYEWLLQIFPSLLELVIQSATWSNFDSYGVHIKNELLKVLGVGWEGTLCPRDERHRFFSVKFRKL